MTTPNQQLAELICTALRDASIAEISEIDKLQSLILAGKVKAEDWYSAIENSLPRAEGEPINGN